MEVSSQQNHNKSPEMYKNLIHADGGEMQMVQNMMF